MRQPAFKIISSIYLNPETGAVEIDLTPDDPKIELTGQQIVDAVVELVIWSWGNTPLEPIDDSEFDS